MADEREARALGAGDFVKVDGEQYTLRPITVQHLMDLERAALSDYKKSYLSTFSENRETLEEVGIDVSSLLMEKMEEVAKWDLSNLPQKEAYSVDNVPLTGKGGRRIREWIKNNHGEIPDSEDGIRIVLVNALDSDKLKVKDIQIMTGATPQRGMIRYDSWWVTASMNGMVAFIITSIKYDHPEMNMKKVARWPFSVIVEASGIVSRLTAASVGNG